MTPPDPTTASGWAVAAVASLAATANWLKSRKKVAKTEEEQETISNAKGFKARSEIFEKLADDNLALYVKEHDAHEKTRDYWHTKASEFQTTLTTCQEKLQELKARPDYSDIVQFISQQAKTSVEILQGIKEILKHIDDAIPRKL